MRAVETAKELPMYRSIRSLVSAALVFAPLAGPILAGPTDDVTVTLPPTDQGEAFVPGSRALEDLPCISIRGLSFGVGFSAAGFGTFGVTALVRRQRRRADGQHEEQRDACTDSSA